MIHSLNNFKNFIILQNLIIFINIIIKKIILNFNKITKKIKKNLLPKKYISIQSISLFYKNIYFCSQY